ncbi:OmpA family protein [Arcobacter sp. CECT 8985]|uniref:OmpA family protein n=1 Tax=Arcobacter sp. CECT 8985 TaxID=1935424 RepID=UPI00100BE162|nr:OmpA family protein [Arcobacter sp. CECT 8985]RXJ87735.1 hypothetical protein CRU93_02780 [Arcobacter sp. CECT 8985]
MKTRKIKLISTILLTSSLLFSGCAQKNEDLSTNKKDEYASTKQGAVMGAFLGVLIGLLANGKHKKQNAAVGAVLGAGIGSAIGYSVDTQAKQIAKELDTKVDNKKEALSNPDNDLVISNTDKYVKIMLRDKMMFKTNSSIPTQEASLKLDKITKVLRKYPNTIVQVVGFTDSRGSYEYNQKLSEQRAKNVGHRIYNSGIENLIYSKGCSYNKPIVANKTKKDMAINRRVEIYLYPNQQDIIDACKK